MSLPSHIAHLLPISTPGTWHPSSHALLLPPQEAHKHPRAPHSRMLPPDVLQQAAPRDSLKAPEQAKSWHWDTNVRIYSSGSSCRGGNCELLLELSHRFFALQSPILTSSSISSTQAHENWSRIFHFFCHHLGLSTEDTSLLKG